MKIAQVCPYNIFRSGGVQSHILFLSDELRKRGHEVKIIAPGVRGAREDQNIILIGSSNEVYFNKTQIEVSIAVGKSRELLKDTLEKEKFDVIHFHEPWVPVLPMQILYESDVTNVGTFHAATTNTLVSQSFETLLMPVASTIVNTLDATVAVSEVPASYLRQISRRNINIVPNGIDLETFNTGNKPFKKYSSGKVIILFLGRLDKRKGVIYLLRAYRRLRKKFQNIKLLIGGKGEELKKLVKYVRKYKLKDVEFLGYVEEEDKPRLYASCDIFCSPALYGESFGIVLLEAMATGKPVVAFSNPGYETVLKGRGSLLLVKPRDTEGLGEKLAVLCNDRDLRNFLGTWGEREAAKYAWPNICDQILEVYRTAIERRREIDVKSKRNGLYKLLDKWFKRFEK
ncbi:glycosyltransferase family 4 protein [Candidatus Dojkabacteria bacterium]|nr:glycosyltransferase family 4 protein [Candidatus Dojkabacteria bacterium]